MNKLKKQFLDYMGEELAEIEACREEALSDCDNSENGELLRDSIELTYNTEIRMWINRMINRGIELEEILERFPEVEEVIK